MKTLVLDIPETVEFDDKEALMAIAAHFYEKGKLTAGQAAQMVGYSKRTFIELMGNYGVSVFNYSADELKEDIENAKRHNI
jgi:predicted HTH domain antitoxin